MGIYALQGPQPVDFNRLPAIGCCGGVAPSLIGPHDDIVFQFGAAGCPNDAVLQEYLSAFIPDGIGWQFLSDGALRVAPGYTVTGTSAMTVTPGEVYRIEVQELNPFGEGFTLRIGGQERTFSEAGSTTWVVVATTSDPLQLHTTEGSSFDLHGLKVYEFGTLLQVLINHPGGVQTFEYLDNTSYFKVDDDRVTVTLPMGVVAATVGDCFTVEVRDCDEEEGIVSQVHQVVEADCMTLLVRTCLNDRAMGFAPFAPRLRVRATLGWAKWEHESEVERDTVGRSRYTFAERTSVYTLRVGESGYHDHNYLSSLPEWHRVYVHSDQSDVLEVFPAAETYDPRYTADHINATAEIELRLKEELVRAVACADEGDGCSPVEDPICPSANLSWYVHDGTLRVTLHDAFGFDVGALIITVGETQYAPEYFDTGYFPSFVDVSVPPEAAWITLRLQNRVWPECADVRRFFKAEEVLECSEPTSLRLVVPETDPGMLALLLGDQPFDPINGVPTGYYTREGGSTYNNDEFPQPEAGEGCFFASDNNGTPTGSAVISAYVYRVDGGPLDITPFLQLQYLFYTITADMQGIAGTAAWVKAFVYGGGVSDDTVNLQAPALTHFLASATFSAFSLQAPLLEFLDLTGALPPIPLSGYPALVEANIRNTSATPDTTSNPALERLWYQTTDTAALDLSNNPALKYLTVVQSSLPSLDLSNNDSLHTVVVSDPLGAASSLSSLTPPAAFADDSGAVTIDINANLDQTSVDAVLAAAVANPNIVSGSIKLDYSNAAPSSSGMADKSTLSGRGVSVTTN